MSNIGNMQRKDDLLGKIKKTKPISNQIFTPFPSTT